MAASRKPKSDEIVRAITIPVAGPMGDATWPELREALKSCWSAATRVSNWAVRELAKNDITRTAEMDKLPKMPALYLYPGARRLAPEMDSQSVSSCLRAVERRYRARRYETVWLCNGSLPNYRYPTPYPCHNQSWKPSFENGGEVPCVSVRLAGKRYLLRLRGGAEFRRQIASFRRLVAGEFKQGELALYQAPSNRADHRPYVKRSRLMCKMVIRCPREAPKDRDGVMLATTSPDSMLVALDHKNNRLFTINGDHVRRWHATHTAQLQRWSEDGKMEERPARFSRRREVAARKFNRRMNTACAQFAAQVVGFADRRRYREIKWVLREERFVESFRWHRLEEEMRYRCDAAGIEFSSEKVIAKSPDPLEAQEDS